MRVTISRKFTIQADIDVSGIATPCRTYAETSGYPGGHAAAGNEIHTHRPAMNPNQTLADMDVYLLNDQAVICTAANCASTSGAQTITYSQGSGSSINLILYKIMLKFYYGTNTICVYSFVDSWNNRIKK